MKYPRYSNCSVFSLVSLFAASSVLNADPANLFEGFRLHPTDLSGIHVAPNGTGPNATTSATLYSTGGLYLQALSAESSLAAVDGGITVQGAPITMLLSNGDGSSLGNFDVWKLSDYGLSSPLFSINGTTGATTFTGSNVAINSGSLSVGGSAVLTAASAPSFLNGQNVVRLSSGGDLVLSSTTASTGSTVGALTVAGGIGVALDSYINGLRIGRGPGNAIASTGNTVLGVEAMLSNVDGTGNVAVGRNSLKAATSASYSTAIGYGSLQSQVSGNGNTAVGYNSLTASTTGTGNTATGHRALAASVTGSSNSAFGSSTLVSTSSGSANSAFGTSSMVANSTGAANSAFGMATLVSNTTGQNNVAIGYHASGYNTTGSSNVAIGYGAGRKAANQSNLINDSNSIYIGSESRGGANTNVNSIVIGTAAKGAGSNTTVIGNDDTEATYLKGETNADSLKVTGKTELSGQVILSEPQGDISMGIYGD